MTATETSTEFSAACRIDVYRVPEDSHLISVATLPPAVDRAGGIETLRRWAADRGANVTFGDEYCDDEVCAFPVDLGDGDSSVVAFLIHEPIVSDHL